MKNNVFGSFFVVSQFFDANTQTIIPLGFSLPDMAKTPVE